MIAALAISSTTSLPCLTASNGARTTLPSALPCSKAITKSAAFSHNHEALLDLFLLVRCTFLGVAFLSAPEYAPGPGPCSRFLKIVVPKMREYLQKP